MLIQNMYCHPWKTVVPCLAHKGDTRRVLPCCAAAEVQNTRSKSSHPEATAVSESDGKRNKRTEISYGRGLHASIKRIQRVGRRLDQKRATQCQQSEPKKACSPTSQSPERVTRQQNTSCRSQRRAGTSEGCHLRNHNQSPSVENSRELDVMPQ